MQWLWDLQPSGASKLLRPIIARMGERQERAIWANMKRCLEAR